MSNVQYIMVVLMGGCAVNHTRLSSPISSPSLSSSNQEHRDLTDNAWQKLTGMVTDGEGLLKEAKELLWRWPLPPVGSVQMGAGEMEQLGRCSRGIKVSLVCRLSC